jgi:hypothetical protein
MYATYNNANYLVDISIADATSYNTFTSTTKSGMLAIQDADINNIISYLNQGEGAGTYSWNSTNATITSTSSKPLASDVTNMLNGMANLYTAVNNSSGPNTSDSSITSAISTLQSAKTTLANDNESTYNQDNGSSLDLLLRNSNTL